MGKTIRQNLACLIPYLLFLLIAGIFLEMHSKGEAHLLLNQYRFGFCDYFFSLATYLGDGYTVVATVVILCFIKYRHAFFVALGNVISAAITQTLKHTFFADQLRPSKYFEGIAQLKLIPWVENYSYNSFPSGHTTAAFTTCLCIALVLENKYLKSLLFLTALAIGLSRVYLSQHFLNDVYAGSVIGVFTSLFVYQYIIISDKIKQSAWMERSILKNK